MVRINEIAAQKLCKLRGVSKLQLPKPRGMAQNAENKNPFRWFFFYYDAADPRIFVPKRIPMLGFTLNYANKFSWLITLIILVVIGWAYYTGMAHFYLP